MRLLTVGHSYCVGVNRRLAHELAREGPTGCEVVVVAPRRIRGDLGPIALAVEPGEPARVEGVGTWPPSPPQLMMYGPRLRSIIRERWDLVHCWEEPFTLAAGQVARWARPGVPLVYWTAQSLPKRYPPPFGAVERACVDRCDGWLASGQTVVEALRPRGTYAEKPHRVMPLGVDAERFRPDAARRADLLQRLGWAVDGPPVVGFLGRFVAEKGVELLMSTIDRLSSAVRVLIVGGGPMEGTLRAWADRRGDGARVVTGVAHLDVPGYLGAMDVLMAPSRTTPRWKEQFGRMIVEAFASGVAVVGSDSGEIPHVVGDAGIVVGEADAAGWAEAVGGLVDDAGRRARLGALGRLRAMAEYRWPVVARKHWEFFDRIIGK